jgi:hypothetical protein
VGLDRELETLHHEAREAGRNFVDGARTVVFGFIFSSWLFIWLLVAVGGWALGVPVLLEAGLGVAGASTVILGASRFRRRRRLARAARWSALARARLERVGLGREIEAVLRAYDLAAERCRLALEQPELKAQANLRVVFERSLDRLVELAREDGRLRGAMRRMRRIDDLGSTRAALDDAEKALAKVRSEADAIAQDAQRVGERLTDLTQLGAGETELSAGQSLAESVTELDRTRAAYRELEESQHRQ